MCNQKISECSHRANGISRRGFLRSACAAVVVSQLLDDLLCFAAESVPSDRPAVANSLAVDVVSVWPKGHANTERMDWGYGNETYNYQRNLYKEILGKAAREIGIEVRFHDPVNTDEEIASLLADLKKTPSTGLILTTHTLSTYGYGDRWSPIQTILDGRGDLPTVVFVNLANKRFGPPVRYGKPFTYSCTAPSIDWLENALRLVSAPGKLNQARILYAMPRPAEKDELENVQVAKSKHPLGPAFVHVPNYLDLYKKYETREEIRKMAEFYRKAAKNVVEPGEQEMLNAAKHYFVLRDLMRERNCQGVIVSGSICIGAPGLPGYGPACVAISRLNDEGFSGTCEGDIDFGVADLVSHMICGRPLVMGNVGHLTATNTLVISHCYSPTKLRGPKDDFRAQYQLRDFHGRKACVIQVFWPTDEKVTFLTPMSDDREYAVGTGHVVSNIAQPPAFLCRTAVEMKADGLDDWDTHTFRADKKTQFTSSYVLGDMREHFDAYGQLAGVKISPIVQAKVPDKPGAPILSLNADRRCSCAYS